MLKVLIFLIFAGTVHSRPKLTPFLTSILVKQKEAGSSSSSSGQLVNLLLSMTDGETVHKNIIEDHHHLKYSSGHSKSKPLTRNQRLTSLTRSLKEEADKVQKNILGFLEKEKLESIDEAIHETYQLWITNQIIVENADVTLLQKLAERADLSKIEEEFMIPLDDPVDGFVVEKNPVTKAIQQPWGVVAVRAPEIWNSLGVRGKNIVVGGIDTGVSASHESLSGNFRKDFGWYDPINGTTLPIDEKGHGTHTMGTIVGTTFGIGVAPEAQWIACRGCGHNGCPTLALLRCGQFMLCPTDPSGDTEDCTKAPHVISNSWGSEGVNGFYSNVIESWSAVGIIPVFSIGNNGPECGKTGSPGNLPNVIGVGSVSRDNVVSNFSSPGPIGNSQEWMKPDIAAPGFEVVSAYFLDDTTYWSKSGTSMSCPHVSGLVALLLSSDPLMDFEKILYKLQHGAVPTSATTGRNCGGISEEKYPNFHVGYGSVDGLKAFSVQMPEDDGHDDSARLNAGTLGLVLIMVAMGRFVGGLNILWNIH